MRLLALIILTCLPTWGHGALSVRLLPVDQRLANGDSVGFNTTDLGGKETRLLSLRNDGTAAEAMPQVTLDGAGASDFALELPSSTEIAPGTAAEVRVTFIPQVENKVSSAVLHLGTVNLTVTATAGTSALKLRVEEVGGAEVTPLTPAFDFGSPRVGSVTVKTFRVTNLSSAPLQSLSASIDDQWIGGGSYYWGYYDQSGFNVKPSWTSPLAPGESGTMQVQWFPFSTATKSRRVALTASGRTGDFQVPIVGAGTEFTGADWRLGGLRYPMGDGSGIDQEVLYTYNGDLSLTRAEAERWTYVPSAPPPAPVAAATASITSSLTVVGYNSIAFRLLYPYYQWLYPPYLTPSEAPARPRFVQISGAGIAPSSTNAAQFAKGSFFSSTSLRLPSTDNVGLEAWVRADTTTGSQCIVFVGESADGGFGLYLETDRIEARIGSSRLRSSVSIASGEWHHVALVMKAGAVTLYLDQTDVGSLASATLPALVKGLGCGATVTGTDAFTGQVDDLRLFEVPSNFDAASDLLISAKPASTLSSATLQMPATGVGSSSMASTLLSNAGKGLLKITNVQFTGPDAADFALYSSVSWPLDTPEGFSSTALVFVQTPISPLPGVGGQTWRVNPGYASKLNVGFIPRAEGPRSATLRLTTNDATHPVYEIALSGTAEAARARLQVTPASRNFGTVLTNQSSSFQFAVKNTGSGAITGLSATATGPHAADIQSISSTYYGTWPGGDASTLAPGVTGYYQVTVRPGAVGARLAMLHLTSNAETIDVPIFGHGQTPAPEITVFGNMIEPVNEGQQALASGSTLNFGSLFTTLRQSSAQIIVNNQGTKELTVTRFEIDGPAAADFALVKVNDWQLALPGAVNSYDAIYYKITFTPRGTGTRSATLHIMSDDADESDFQIQLTGSGLPPAPVLRVGNGDIANTFLRLGTAVVRGYRNANDLPPTQTLAVTNQGTADLTNAQLSFTGPNAADFSATISGDIVVGGSGSITVTFDPSAPGTRSAVLHVQTTAATFDIPVGGTGAFGEKASLTPGLPAGWETTAMLPFDGENVMIAGSAPNVGPVIGWIDGDGNLHDGVPQPPDHRILLASPGAFAGFGSLRPDGSIKSMAKTADGGVLFTGDFRYIQVRGRAYIQAIPWSWGDPYQGVGKMGGTQSFAPPTGDFVGRAVVALPNGKVLLGGSGSLGGRKHLIRLNADGSLDSTFTLPEPDGPVNALALQDDGKVLVGGEFTNLGQAYVPGRYHQTGSASVGLNAISINFYGPSSQPPTGLCRLNADGTNDAFFGNPGFSQVTALAVRGDRIAVGGVEKREAWPLEMSYMTNSSTLAPATRVISPYVYEVFAARLLNLTGQTLASEQLENKPRVVALQPGSRMLVAPGNTTWTYPLHLRTGVALIQPASESFDHWGLKIAASDPSTLAPSASLGLTYSVPLTYRVQEFDGTVNALVPQADGKLLVGGATSMARVIPINADGFISSGMLAQPTLYFDTDPLVDETPVNGFLQLDRDGFFNRPAPIPGSDGLRKITLSATHRSEQIIVLPTSSNPTWTLDGPDADSFQILQFISDPIPGSGAVSQTGLVAVFDPKRGGTQRAVLHLRIQGHHDPFDIALEGTAKAAIPDTLKVVSVASGVELVSGDSVAFGEVGIGSVEVRSFQLRNTSTNAITQPLVLTLSGGNASEFEITEAPIFPIKAGGVASFSVAFKPAAATPEVRTANLQLSDGSSLTPAVIRLTGKAVAPPSFHGVVLLQDQLLFPGEPLTLSYADLALTGLQPVNWQWFKNGRAVFLATTPTLTVPSVSTADAGNYVARLSNQYGTADSRAVRVAVIDSAPQTLTRLRGSRVELECKTTGSPLTYQWFKNGQPLSPLPKVTGITTSKLVLTRFDYADSGDYTCEVRLGTVRRMSAVTTLRVLGLPVVTGQLDDSTWRARDRVAQTLAVTNGPAKLYASGLPPGLALNPVTGIVSGTLTQPGTFRVRVRAVNQIGMGPVMEQTVTVAPLLDYGRAGSFYTVVPRNAEFNDRLGGTLTFVTTASGAITGKLRLGSSRKGTARVIDYPFAGVMTMDASTDYDASVTLRPFKNSDGNDLVLSIKVVSATDPMDVNGIVGGFEYRLRSGDATLTESGWGRKLTMTSRHAGKWSTKILRGEVNGDPGDPSAWPEAGSFSAVLSMGADAAWSLRTKLSNGSTLVCTGSSLVNPYVEAGLFAFVSSRGSGRTVVGSCAVNDAFIGTARAGYALGVGVEYGDWLQPVSGPHLGSVSENFHESWGTTVR